MNIIDVKELCFRYNSNDVLNNISFSVSSGDYIGLVGPNGSGKTTLIKIILGILEPEKGTVSLFGINPVNFKERYRIGYLPQRTHFNPYFPATVREIIFSGLYPKKKKIKNFNKSVEEIINETMKLMDVIDIQNALIGELSGGQLQRVLVGRAIVNEPELLILDEPTTALDPETREKFFHILQELNKIRNTTIILVTHDIGSIGKFASKLLYLDKSIIFYGSFEDFCASKEMGSYFGEFAQHLICHRHD
ncbi:MAG: metal ABC transporter ATP-binding protein [Thermodesulfovibrionales bacterium]